MNSRGEILSQLNDGIFLKTLIWLDSLQHQSPYRLSFEVEAEYRRTVFSPISLSDIQNCVDRDAAAPFVSDFETPYISSYAVHIVPKS